ncbi:hypothetical protein K7X08_034359 [Anisodus acutangulus]|uniref:Uncharacterized protein n=1 Tax=Anisodus acutangulus TaxID=402998 RepID=A0A9Q1LIY5_9SOLA|nr:hypothetical protein K7X08_034359 [Anisodus acutangulus]
MHKAKATLQHLQIFISVKSHTLEMEWEYGLLIYNWTIVTLQASFWVELGPRSIASPTTGDLEQAQRLGLFRANCTHQVGIATATEVGLSQDRFPIRVILTADPATVPDDRSIITCKYWRVTNANLEDLTFNRKALDSNLPVSNLYALFPDFDDMMWENWRAITANGAVVVREMDAAITTQSDALYAILNLQSPTVEQKAQAATILTAIMAACTPAHRIPYFRIGNNVFLRAEPAGRRYAAIGAANRQRVALLESALCLHINYTRLMARYPAISNGAASLASYAMACMFRFGLYEVYEHREYHTVIAQISATAPTTLVIHSVRPAPGAAAVDNLAAGTVYDMTALRFSQKFTELGNLTVLNAGLMHYLFNHTTGGNVAMGSLLSVLSMHRLITAGMTPGVQAMVTNVFYEALHPVNKRAVANIFFGKSLVWTHARSPAAGQIEQFKMDSFAAIRSNPYPAGSHKAFVCLQTLKRVLQAGLGAFLPWADQLAVCIEMCRGVLNSGARAHIGANYYTGESPNVQPASIDNYLPELACYIHTFNRGDSLAMSPHMGLDISKRAAMNWQNLLKDLKAKDVSATSTEQVRAFLATSGSVHFAFDPADQATWAQAVADQKAALAHIDNQFT